MRKSFSFKDIAVIFLLLLNFSAVAFAQQLTFTEVLKMPDDTIKIESLKLLANDYLKQERTDSASFSNQKTIDVCIRLKRFDRMVGVYSDRQKIYSGVKNDAQAFKALSLSLQKCLEVKYILGVSNTCPQHCNLLFRQS